MSTSTTKKVYTVDGSRFSTLAECAAEFTRVLGLTMPWNGNLDAFNDFLRGGFGTPDDGFILTWRHSEISRERLGYGETLLWLEERVHHCHPSTKNANPRHQTLCDASLRESLPTRPKPTMNHLVLIP